MSIVKQNRLWNGVAVRVDTNIETGAVFVYAPKKGVFGGDALLFTSNGRPNDWEVQNPQTAARLFNNSNNSNSSAEDVEQAFLNEGYKTFDDDRANVINDPENYESPESAVVNQTALAEKGVPRVTNPGTGQTNNSAGVATDTVDETDEGGPNPSPNTGGSTADVTDSDFVLGTVAEVEVEHDPTAVYRYPLGRVPDLGYDFVQIRAYEYDAGDVLTSGKGSPRETFILPLIPSLEETNATNWGDDTMNFIQKAAADTAFDTIRGFKDGSLGEALANGLNVAKENITELVNNADTKQAIIGYFAGQAAQTNVLARGDGVVINPNLELLFKGPTLRTFQFNFKLRPRDPDEAKVIKDMIRAFKKNMNPRRTVGQIFLKTPSIFEIQYSRGGEPHPFMNEIGDCALQNFKVNYTPDGNYMTYEDGSMTGYDISLQFSELFPVFADEQNEAGGTGK